MQNYLQSQSNYGQFVNNFAKNIAFLSPQINKYWLNKFLEFQLMICFLVSCYYLQVPAQCFQKSHLSFQIHKEGFCLSEYPNKLAVYNFQNFTILEKSLFSSDSSILFYKQSITLHKF
ncbi:hypothetical protein ABPG72_013320 [Tetrahymena utriculariae]